MELNDSFWKHFELDLQEIKLAYLNWAIGYAKEPEPDHRHLFRWDHQNCFCLINSRYGCAFSFSPLGPGLRGVRRPKHKSIPRGLDEIDIALKVRLTENTKHIRSAISHALETGQLKKPVRWSSIFAGSSLVPMNFFLIELSSNMMDMGRF